MSDVPPPHNGRPTWRDLEKRDARIQESLDKRLDRAHNYANDRLDEVCRDLSDTKVRVDLVESVLDQQRGARNLVYLLIGSNVLMAVVGGLAILGILINGLE